MAKHVPLEEVLEDGIFVQWNNSDSDLDSESEINDRIIELSLCVTKQLSI